MTTFPVPVVGEEATGEENLAYYKDIDMHCTITPSGGHMKNEKVTGFSFAPESFCMRINALKEAAAHLISCLPYDTLQQLLSDAIPPPLSNAARSYFHISQIIPSTNLFISCNQHIASIPSHSIFIPIPCSRSNPTQLKFY